MATQLPPIAAVDPAVSATGSIVLPPETVVAPEEPVVPAVPAAASADDIEKDPNGLYHLKVGNKEYKAKTIKALLQETAKAIANGDSRIKELNTELKIKKGVITPDRFEMDETPRVAPLTADEQFQLSQDLLRPDAAPKAVRRFLEAELGAPLETIKNDRDAAKQARFKELAFAAGKEFVKAHPEFVPSQANEAKLFDFMEQQNIPPISLKNYEIAYGQIKDILDLRDEAEIAPVVPKPTVPAPAAPAVTPPAAAPVAPARPRQATTGVTSSATSVPAGATSTVLGIPGYPTREQVIAATAKQMETWATRFPKFNEHMEALFAPKK